MSDTPSTNTNSYFFELPEITTNLAPSNDKESWIKFAITLQLENSKDQAALDKKIPMIKDSIIVFLREIRSSDLGSSGGSLMLKTELLKRINKIMYPIALKDILFREILLDQ
jgi:flagellar FliL protein